MIRKVHHFMDEYHARRKLQPATENTAENGGNGNRVITTTTSGG